MISQGVHLAVRATIVFGCLTMLAPAAAAQRADAAQARAPLSTPKLVAGGLIGGALGLLAGGVVGTGLRQSRPCPDEQWVCNLHGAIWGATIGESVGIPLGVRKAGGRNLGAMLAVSTGIGIAGLFALKASHYDSPQAPIILVAVPLLQLTASVAIAKR